MEQQKPQVPVDSELFNPAALNKEEEVDLHKIVWIT